MRKIVVVLLFFNVFVMLSQEDNAQQIDALKAQIATAEGGDKLTLLDSLSRFVGDQQFDSISQETIALAYELDSLRIASEQTANLIYYYLYKANKVDEAIALFEAFDNKQSKTSDQKSLAKTYTNGATSYFFIGDLNKAIDVYGKAEEFALAGNDSLTYAQARAYKASAHSENGNYATAAELLKETAAIFTIKKDTAKLLESRMISSAIYGRVGFYKEAQYEIHEIIKLAELTKNHNLLITNLYNAAINHHKLGQHAQRLQTLQKAYNYVNVLPKENQRYKPLIKYGLLSAYTRVDSLSKATQLYDEIEQEVKGQNDIVFGEYYLSAKVSYLYKTQKYQEALINAKKLLESYKQANNIEGIYNAHEKLADCYKALNDFDNAYTNFIAYENLKDSLTTIQKVKSLFYYQTLYETEKRDFKIASQKTEIVVLDQKNKVKQQWLIFGGLGLLAVFVMIYLIRTKKFAQKQQVLQEQFSQDLINGQEEERSRLARELHDSVGQKLMLLSKQTKKIDQPNMENLASSTLEEIRSISRGLHPSNLERLGLTTAINALVYDINANTELFFTEEIDDIDNILSKESELHLYRIIQETLSNIVKHSEAKAVKMEIQKKENRISVIVSDNGKGFDFESKYKNMSLGLKTLYERAKILGAQLQLDSKINNGTEMRLNISI